MKKLLFTLLTLLIAHSAAAQQYIDDRIISPTITRDAEIIPTGETNAICISNTGTPAPAITLCSTLDLTAKTVLVKLPEYTVATLPASHPLVIVIDGNSSTDCIVGTGSTRVLCHWNGSAWASLGGGGGGSPGGADTQVQFNDGGAAFGGDAGLVFNKTTNVLTVSGDVLIGAQSVCQENGTNCPSAGAETDPVVGAINGIVKANGAGTISAASAGTDYVIPAGNVATATALAANAANCNAGAGAAGVDTAGAAENCVDFMEEPGGNGIVARTAANTSANRTITGTGNNISVANGNGVSGNPTIDVGTNVVKVDTPGTWIPPVVTVATLPATPSNGQEATVTDGDTSSDCTTGLGSTRVRCVWNSGTATWEAVSAAAATPTLQQAYAAGSSIAADCSAPFKAGMDPSDPTTYWKICHDATDGLVFVPVVAGVENAGNRRVKLTTGGDWCILNNADVCLFKLTEAGVFSGTAVKKTVEVIPFDFTTDVTTGDGKFYLRVPTTIDGYSLSGVQVNVITAGTTNPTTIGIDRCAATTSGNVCSGTVTDMLATGFSVDTGENSSSDAATPGALSGTPANLVVTAGQIIRVNVDAVSTTAPKGLIVAMDFTAP